MIIVHHSIMTHQYIILIMAHVWGPCIYSYFEKGCRKKKHQRARDMTERWYGYSLEFCILA